MEKEKEDLGVYSVGVTDDISSKEKKTRGDSGSPHDEVEGPKLSHGILARLPQDTAFQQQRLKSWQPILSPRWVVIIFSAITIIFIPIGAGILAASNSIVQLSQRYDNLSFPCLSTSTYPSLPAGSCVQQFNVTVPADMSSPVYVYYQLTEYYQNHRIYSTSRSDYQLEGMDGPNLATCIPSETEYNNAGQTLYPCGLIPASVFNDSFGATLFPNANPSQPFILGNLTNNSDSNPYWQKSGIAWAADRETRFSLNEATVANLALGVNSSFTRQTPFGLYDMPLPNDEDLMVWMRVAGLPSFKKLYRVVNYDLNEGDVVQFSVNNVYSTSGFGGQKSIFMTTTNVLGGQNSFLGWCYITVGIITALFAFVFAVKNALSPREMGDLTKMTWPEEKNS